MFHSSFVQHFLCSTALSFYTRLLVLHTHAADIEHSQLRTHPPTEVFRFMSTGGGSVLWRKASSSRDMPSHPHIPTSPWGGRRDKPKRTPVTLRRRFSRLSLSSPSPSLLPFLSFLQIPSFSPPSPTISTVFRFLSSFSCVLICSYAIIPYSRCCSSLPVIFLHSSGSF